MLQYFSNVIQKNKEFMVVSLDIVLRTVFKL